MYKVKIYIMAEPANTRKSKNRYGFLLTCRSSGKEEVRIGGGEIEGTYHAATLQAINEALGRLRQSCEVSIHCEDRFVLNMMKHNLGRWAANGYRTSKGRPAANEDSWRECWRLTRGQKVIVIPGRHEKEDQIRREIKRIEEEKNGSRDDVSEKH